MTDNLDVFISYNMNSATDIANQIAESLKQSGISCWYALKDMKSGTYAEIIEEAISKCKVFLLILNEQANQSKQVLSEVHLAFQRYERGEPIVLLPFRIGKCRPSGAMDYYIGYFHMLKGNQPPSANQIEALTEHIRVVLADTTHQTDRNIPLMKGRPNLSATNEKRKPKKAIGFVAMVILAALLIISFLMLNNPRNEDANATDSFGRPLVREALCVYHEDIKIGRIYDDLSLGADMRASFYINGLSNEWNDNVAEYIPVTKNNPKTLTEIGSQDQRDFAKQYIGDGSIVEVYYAPDDSSIIICAMSVYAGKVIAIQRDSAQGAFVTLDFAGEATGRRNPISASVSERDADRFENGDIVVCLYSYRTNQIEELLYKASSEEGRLMRRVVNKSLVTTDGISYSYAKHVIFNLENGEDGLEIRNDYSMFFSEQDYVIWIEEAPFSPEEYALLLDLKLEVEGVTYSMDHPYGTAGGWNSGATLLFFNGSEKTVRLDSASRYLEASNNSSAPALMSAFREKAIVRCIDMSNNTVRLMPVKQSRTMKSVYAGDETGCAVMNGTVLMDGGAIRTNQDTIFVVRENGEYKIYIGNHMAPTISKGTAYGYAQGGIARLLFVTDGLVTLRSPMVIVGKTRNGPIYEHGQPCYQYHAIVNGEITTVKVHANASIVSVFDGKESFMIPASDNVQTHENLAVLDTVVFDDNDILISGKWTSDTLTVHRICGENVTEGAHGDAQGVCYYIDNAGNISLAAEWSENEAVLIGDPPFYYWGFDNPMIMDDNDWIYWVLNEKEEFIEEVYCSEDGGEPVDNDWIYWDWDDDYVFLNEIALLTRITCEQGGVSYRSDPLGLYGDASIRDGNKAHLIFANGVESNVDLDKAYIVESSEPEAVNGFKFDMDYAPPMLVRYTRLPDATWQLETVPESNLITNSGDEKNGAGFVIKRYAIEINGAKVTADSETYFVIQSYSKDTKLPVFRNYLGIRNIPDISSGNVYVYHENNRARLVYIINARGD